MCVCVGGFVFNLRKHNFYFFLLFFAEGPKGISCFIVDKNSPGLSFGAKEKKVSCDYLTHALIVTCRQLQISWFFSFCVTIVFMTPFNF